MTKIDKSILNKIRTQSNEKLPVLVYYCNYGVIEKMKKWGYIEHITNFPFIRAVSGMVSANKILSLSNFCDILYISSICNVTALMDRAREISKYENIITNEHTFTCAIIDTGIDIGIDMCVPQNRLVFFKDFVNDKSEPYDDNGHGTFVANVLCGAGIVSNGKFRGVDSKVKYIVLKALDKMGEGSATTILQAMQWVVDNKDKYNIKVVCMSFGSIPQEFRDPLVVGAEVLWDNGITVVCAGGNSGPDIRSIMSPATSKKIITVGAMDDGRGSGVIRIPAFSSRGPAYNNYKPDVVASGVDIIAGCSYHKFKSHYAMMSGTSVATPIVAGVVCRLIANNKNLTPMAIKHILIKHSKTINGDRNSEGFGYIFFG